MGHRSTRLSTRGLLRLSRARPPARALNQFVWRPPWQVSLERSAWSMKYGSATRTALDLSSGICQCTRAWTTALYDKATWQITQHRNMQRVLTNIFIIRHTWALQSEPTFERLPSPPTSLFFLLLFLYTRAYPKLSRLAAWAENCKWHSSLPLGAVVSLFCESVYWVLPPQPFVLLLNECLLLRVKLSLCFN
jgi:hypothetical protein